jgi:acyl carrier protein
MTRTKAIELVQQAILEHEYQGPDSYTLTSSISDDIGADSLDVVEMIMIVEEKTGIEFPPQNLSKFKTVEDMVKFLENYD